MAKNLFGFHSEKWSPGQLPCDVPEQFDRRRLSISRSGRFKEQSKKRIALVDNIYNDPKPEEKIIHPSNVQDESMERRKSDEENTRDIANATDRNSQSDLDRRQAALSKIRLQLKEVLDAPL